MKCTCTVLCENSVAGSLGFIGEHGWAVHIETDNHNILFDTGQGLGISHNSNLLNIDLAKIDGIAISHGHYDHTSGLPAVLSITGKKDVFIHPDAFHDRYWLKDDECREIGIKYKKSHLESVGAVFQPNTSCTEIFPNIFLSGEVPRTSSFEQPDPYMKLPTEGDRWLQDQLPDDQSLIIRTEKGLTIILGCAHAGLINILNHVTNLFPEEKIHSVCGGTHLGFADPEQFTATVKALESFDLERIGTSHCTGLLNAAKLQNHFGDKFFFAAVGCKFKC